MDDDWNNGLGVPTTVVASDMAIPSVFKFEQKKKKKKKKTVLFDSLLHSDCLH